MCTAAPSMRQRPSEHELIGLSIVHRHGDRTPITQLANVEYWKSTLPREGETSPLRLDGSALDSVDREGQAVLDEGPGQIYGQLTAKGCDQLQALGALLRGRLIESDSFTGNPNFLPSILPALCDDTHTVEVFSTRFARTIQSTQWLLRGLWPEGAREPSTSIPISTAHHRLMVPDHPERPEAQLALEDEVHATEAWTAGLLETHALHAGLMRGFRGSGLFTDGMLDLDWVIFPLCFA